LDDAFSPPKTVEQTRRLIEQEGVSIIFGSLGPGNLAVREYLNDKHIPQIFVLAPAETYNDPQHFPWTIGLQPTFYLEGKIHARYILAHSPMPKSAFFT
jgi:branched-chain amino acid transport system substrate-binding protein